MAVLFLKVNLRPFEREKLNTVNKDKNGCVLWKELNDGYIEKYHLSPI